MMISEPVTLLMARTELNTHRQFSLVLLLVPNETNLIQMVD